MFTHFAISSMSSTIDNNTSRVLRFDAISLFMDIKKVV